MVAVSLALRSLLVRADMPKTQSTTEMEAVNLFIIQTHDIVISMDCLFIRASKCDSLG